MPTVAHSMAFYLNVKTFFNQDTKWIIQCKYTLYSGSKLIIWFIIISAKKKKMNMNRH